MTTTELFDDPPEGSAIIETVLDGSCGHPKPTKVVATWMIRRLHKLRQVGNQEKPIFYVWCEYFKVDREMVWATLILHLEDWNQRVIHMVCY